MKHNIKSVFVIIAVLFTAVSYAQETIKPEDLKVILGDWKGSLTYIDYGTNKPFTMLTNLVVKEGKNDYQYILQIAYPQESNANSKEKIKLSKDGSQINKTAIKSIENLADGQVKVITQYAGKDAGQKAQIRTVYIFGASKLVLRKDVKFETSEDWLMRNEYSYTR